MATLQKLSVFAPNGALLPSVLVPRFDAMFILAASRIAVRNKMALSITEWFEEDIRHTGRTGAQGNLFASGSPGPSGWPTGPSGWPTGPNSGSQGPQPQSTETNYFAAMAASAVLLFGVWAISKMWFKR